MRTCNHIFSTIAGFESFLSENEIDRNASMLVRVHTGIHSAEEMKLLLPELEALLPHAVFIGCSSETVIFEGRCMQDVCMLSVTLMEECYVKSTHIRCFSDDTARSGTELAMQLIEELALEDKHGLLLVFFPQGYYRAAKFAETIDAHCPNLRLCGGMAHDALVSMKKAGRLEEKDFTISGGYVGRDAMTAAIISGDQLRCFESYALGVEVISSDKHLERFDGNIIYQVEGLTPSQWLKKLGVTTENIEMTRIFPIIRKKHRNCAWPMVFFGGDPALDAIMILDELEEGEMIGLGYINPDLVVDEVKRMYHRIMQRPAETMFVYSCTLRSQILQNCSTWEMTPLMTTTASGALLGGEFYYDGRNNRFGNCTFVVSSLAMGDVYMNLRTHELDITNRLHHDNEHLVNYLTESAKNPDGVSSFYREIKSRLYSNEDLRLGRQSKLDYDIQHHHVNKLCMISLRNADEMIAYAGYPSYEQLKVDIVGMVQRFLKDYKIWYCVSEQDDLMLTTNDTFTSEEFESLMFRLQEFLSMSDYNRLPPVYEFVLVMNEPNLFRCAKVAQISLRKCHDRNFLVYSAAMGMEENTVQDVRMVKVIRDAISHNWVKPYYQGIHDNNAKEITMFEALMRLTDAYGRIYYPNDFLPVAKKYSLYCQLSRQMVGKVMKEFEQRDTRVTINLTMEDIIDSKMTEMIYTNMKYSRHPQNYVFEVVETEDIHDYEKIAEFSQRIHDFGGQIALDDFGSGFSNLIHVIRMDLDYLKIDGDIIRKICDDQDCYKLLQLVAAWCKLHEKKVIAEYVENHAIQEVLCEFNVDYSQGYLFSKPKTNITFEFET